MLLQEPVQSAVWDALNHYSYADAAFLAERLYAEVKTDEALFLLATSYYRAGKVMRAYSLLKNHGQRSPQSKYLLARCCVDTKRLYEAESILSVNLFAKPKSHDEIMAEFGACSSHIFSLLGHIYSKTDRHSKARECYKHSLKLNPLLWNSYVRLCDMGENVDPEEIFQSNESSTQICDNKAYQSYHTSGAAVSVSATNAANTTQAMTTPTATVPPDVTPSPDCLHETPTNIIPTMQLILPSAPKTRRSKPTVAPSTTPFISLSSSSPLSPSFGMLPLDTPSPVNEPPMHLGSLITPSPTSFIDSSDAIRAPNKRPTTRRGQNQNQNPIIHKPPVFSQSGTNVKDIPSPVPAALNTNISNVRRSSRLFTNSLNSSVKENNKTQGRMKFSSPKVPGRKVKSQFIKTSATENNENVKDSVVSMNAANAEATSQAQLYFLQRQSLAGILNLMKTLGKAHLALTQYRCQDAIQLYSEVSPQQYNTTWVLRHVAKAFFEINDFHKAVRMFEELRLMEPYCVEGMELYSTSLWHLQRDVQLSALARDLTEFDKMSPEVWCATGNCFSLQKEHDTAIKFLKRAIQIAPDFCYAYTLLGHEYVFTEELDKALAAFRNALRCNPRHYNALYGVGMIYYKQEQYRFAEFHFRKALSIHPESSVLLCHIAVVQHALQKSDQALVTLDRAIATDPRNPLCKFHRATILFSSDRNKEALAELEELKQIVPKESLIYFLIGKVHKKLGNTHLALTNFSWAMDLDPKGANNQIKEAIDKRYVTEDDGDSTSQIDDTALAEASVAVPEAAGEMVDASNNSSVLGDADMQLQAMESDDSL